jgi:hypothetical protein
MLCAAPAPSAPDDVGVTGRPSRVRVLGALDDQDAGALAEHEAVAPTVERAARLRRVGPAGGERPRVGETGGAGRPER